MDKDVVNKISNYTDVIIFSVVFAVQLCIFIIRRFKLDISATITLLAYLGAQFTRFLRSLILEANRETSALSVGINVICTVIVSTTMVHFVFEMESVRVTADDKRIYRFKITKTILIVFLVIHAIVFDIPRVAWSFGRDLGTIGEVFMVFPGILKVIADICTYYFFILAFSFLIQKKRQTQAKEALGLTPLNIFIIVSIYIMFMMRVVGTIFATIVDTGTFFDFYSDPWLVDLRVLMANIVLPIRDFVEILFFCYMFFIQSQKRSKLLKINESYNKMMEIDSQSEQSEVNLEDNIHKTEERRKKKNGPSRESQFVQFLQKQVNNQNRNSMIN